MLKSAASTNFDLIWAREHAGLTQNAAAQKLTTAGLKTSARTISQWETGATAIPRRKWFKVLEVLGVQEADIPKHEPVTPAPPAASKTENTERRITVRRLGVERRAPALREQQSEDDTPEIIQMRVGWVVEKVRAANAGSAGEVGYDTDGYPLGWPTNKLLEVDVDRRVELPALRLIEGAAFGVRQEVRDRALQARLEVM